MNYKYTAESVNHANKLPAGTVSHRAHKMGMEQCEPLIVMLDSLLKYAHSYQTRFDSKLSEDYVLGPLWLQSAVGVRGLLNGDGQIAMEKGITTDSKDNGALEALFWDCMNAAGFTEADL